MFHRRLVLCLSLVPIGCAASTESSAEPEARAEASPSQAESEPEPPSTSALDKARRSVTEHMPAHFERAADLEHALIRGDLDQARAAANELALHRPDRYPETWAPFVLGMRVRAEDAAKADDTEAMAVAVGEMIGSCGACHVALGARVEPRPEQAPPFDAADPVTMMKRHRWAASRLRAGVVEPSEHAWHEGVEAFAPLPTPSCPDDFGGERLVDVTAVQSRFHATLEHARDVDSDSVTDRAAVYGQLLGTCADCHTGC